jgi:hypothetical protein
LKTEIMIATSYTALNLRQVGVPPGKRLAADGCTLEDCNPQVGYGQKIGDDGCTVIPCTPNCGDNYIVDATGCGCIPDPNPNPEPNPEPSPCTPQACDAATERQAPNGCDCEAIPANPSPTAAINCTDPSCDPCASQQDPSIAQNADESPSFGGMPMGEDNGGGDGSDNSNSGDNGYSPSLKDDNMRAGSKAEGMSGYEPIEVTPKPKKLHPWDLDPDATELDKILFIDQFMFGFGNIAGAGAKVATQWHHLIPKAVYDELGLKATKLLKNGKDNLLELPKWFHANHPRYSEYVKNRVNKILDNSDDILNDLIKLENELRDEVIRLLKEAEKNGSKTKLNNNYPPCPKK